MADFETPTLKPWPEIPPIEIGAMAHSKPYRRQARTSRRRSAFRANWSTTGSRSRSTSWANWWTGTRAHCACFSTAASSAAPAPTSAITTSALRIRTTCRSRARTCCAACTDVITRWRANTFPKLVGARDLDQDLLDEWYSYFHQCSQCRRCSVYCPYGIDTAEISMAARDIMDTVGVGQKYCNEIIGKAQTIGNNSRPAAAGARGYAGRPRGRHRGRNRRHRAPAARRKRRRHPAGHAVGRFLRRTPRRRPDRLRQGISPGRFVLDHFQPRQ